MELDDCEGNSPSPFKNLKEDSSQDGKPIWRTGSLDEGWRKMPAEVYSDENQDHESSVVTALHSSFDASLLEDEGQSASIFRPTSAGKHARNAEEPDVVAPGTVRKLRRRSDLPPGPKNTPGRHSHNLRTKGSAKTAKGERTPTSAARRRRGTHQRRSPRHQALSRIPPAATPVTFKFQDTTSPATPRVSLFDSTTQLKPPQILTPTRAAATPALPQATAVKKTQTNQTATTVNSSFDGMNDSHETSSPTPFRFTSFPASLPRVNNPRSTDRNYMCPPSTRKHMNFLTFADEGGEDDGEKGDNVNSSQEEDGTHNSSLSSLSADAHREVAAPSVQPKALQWKSPEDADMNYRRKNSIDSEVAEARLGVASPVHARLFAEDEMAESPGQDSKMKLDFKPLASPTKPHGDGKGVKYVFGNEKDSDIDLSRPYEQRKTSSFPSTASSTTPLRNISTFEDGTIDSGMTPSGPSGINMADSALSPEQQVKFHFHVDASQCSPIPGIPEEEDDGVTRSVPAMAMMDTDAPTLEPSATLRPVKERPPRSAPRKRSQRRSGGSQSSTRKNSTPSKQESSKLSLSNESGDGGSSSTSSNLRRLRPMPDMNAFDAGVSTRSASSSRNDTDDSSGTMMANRAAPPSPQLVCPPTPQRTPAWAAYSDQGPQPKYARQNSLIATKVLATCPSQVLDGHSSLENSLMEDDEDESVELVGPLFGRKPSLPFSAVAEDMEGEEEEGSPIRDLSGLHEMLTAEPSSALMPRLTRHTSAPVGNFSVLPTPLVASTSCSGRVGGDSDSFRPKGSVPKTPASPRLSSGSFGGVGSVISFSSDFENLGKLGSGAFADVYKVRSKTDQQLYAVKRNRRHFRGKRDREMAMAEVRIMQRLQSVCAHSGAASSDKKEKTKNSYSLYLLFFLRAWQEEGHFFCQTELCCRDTCREMKISLGPQWPTSQRKYPSLFRHFPAGNSETDGHLIPERTVWKICHDVAAGLSHIHSHGVVHNDIKSSNIFLVAHNRLGALLKIGDFGIAGDIGTSEDGQEGDTSYMAPELLSSGTRHPSADIFSLGLTLYELASNLSWELPSEGPRWQELRHGSHTPDLPSSRSPELGQLIHAMLKPDPTLRPSADAILDHVTQVKEAGNRCDEFLRDYIRDIEAYDRVEEERLALEKREAAER